MCLWFRGLAVHHWVFKIMEMFRRPSPGRPATPTTVHIPLTFKHGYTQWVLKSPLGKTVHLCVCTDPDSSFQLSLSLLCCDMLRTFSSSCKKEPTWLDAFDHVIKNNILLQLRHDAACLTIFQRRQPGIVFVYNHLLTRLLWQKHPVLLDHPPWCRTCADHLPPTAPVPRPGGARWSHRGPDLTKECHVTKHPARPGEKSTSNPP